jgi:thiamine-monophosphate kinase
MTTPSDRVASLGEHAVLERIRSRVPPNPGWVTLGIGDDAAVVVPERNRSEVLTTDALVEGVHFDRAYVPADAIGHKALAVNLSDLAAMGAQPRLALLSLILPGDLLAIDLDQMLDALLALATRHDVSLVGGNISRSPGPLVVDVTVLGTVHPRRVLRRAGARPGDGVYVTGSIGAAFAGYLSLSHAVAGGPDLHKCFLRPEPRIRLGLLLGRNRVASACVDLSDGLADGVRQLATASGVGIRLDASALPIPPEARQVFAVTGRDPVDAALSGGEDYELLFTVPRRRRRALDAVLRLAEGVPCTRIGTVTTDRELLLEREGRPVPLPGGFVHFR